MKILTSPSRKNTLIFKAIYILYSLKNEGVAAHKIKERDAQVGAIDTEPYYHKYIELLSKKLDYLPDKWTKLIPERYFEE